MVDLIRLRTILGGPETAWILERLRERYKRGMADTAGTMALRNATQAQREAMDRLLGRRPTEGSTLTVSLVQLRQLLVHGHIADDLREAVEELTGPLVNHREQRTQERARWDELFAAGLLQLANEPAKRQWLHEIKSTGLLRRLSGGDLAVAGPLLKNAIGVVNRLPEQGILLAQLAAAVTGDSHALDYGRPLGTLVIRAAALLTGAEKADTADSRRRVWDSVGVICDELSAPVLALNLDVEQVTLTGRILHLCAQYGEPCRLTARLLLRHPLRVPSDWAGRRVFVCENANVLAAAARELGTDIAPLVCLDGQPTTAGHLLLTALRQAGVQLLYHGDFDWGGIRIANLVIRRHGALPWRMAVTDYQAAASDGLQLEGEPVRAIWNGALTEAMARQRVAVHEERIVAFLIEDLARARADVPDVH